MPPLGRSWSLHCEHKGRLCITMDTVGLPFYSSAAAWPAPSTPSPAPSSSLLHLGLADFLWK